MTNSGNSEDKILIFNNTGPPDYNWMLFKKLNSQNSQKSISYKENKEKHLINKVKCFTDNKNHEV